jgi:hypothetical protein
MNRLLTRLSNLYGPPKDVSNMPGFLAEYEKAMAAYVDSEMELAADAIRDTRKYRTWPSIPECLSALARARTELRRKVTQTQTAKQQTKAKYTPAQLREAEQFVDACAAGEIDMGFCSAKLRAMALDMQARRGRS